MEVDEFVAKTIEQIVTGVVRAQRKVDDLGAQINPTVDSGQPGLFDSRSGARIQDVEFDIAVYSLAERDVRSWADCGHSVDQGRRQGRL